MALTPSCTRRRIARKGVVLMIALERPGRASSIALSIAGVWGLGLVVAGFFVPVYHFSGWSSSGGLTRSTATLVDVNGLGVVVVLALPVVATVLVTFALLVRSQPGAMAAAWVLTVLLAGFNLLAMLSIGVFVVPVTAALVVACASASGAKVGAATTG
ncbi:MAG TPA: hypothetical protein VF165_12325 [Nocardioidaceae bacterium]